jgi:hypothetical protein
MLRLGSRAYPVVLPNARDPRLHLAAVIISIHVLGQTALGFRISVPQILAAIVTCALIEVAWALRTTSRVVWPASAMLTGSGVALIFRVLDTPRGDHWTWHGWHLFALVAGASLLTKYVIRHRGSHVFNPSNIGLVVAFLVIGSDRVAPLDFWWAPLTWSMAMAYLLVIIGGLVITARLHLLAMAVAFWGTLVAGTGLLAASGHCFVAEWALEPVCGAHFWWVVATSPEVLIFLFFMITDPKTIPTGASPRIVFGVLVAIVATLLIAPQTTEFGAKVGLLVGLAVMSPLRYLMDRDMAAAPALAARPTGRLRRVTVGAQTAPSMFGGGFAIGVLVFGLGTVIVLAGGPARVPAQALARLDPPDIEVRINPTALPAVTIDEGVAALAGGLGSEGARGLASMLAENLEIEAQAVEHGDAAMLRGADFGERLAEMEESIDTNRQVARYTFESLHLRVVLSEGAQAGPSLAFDARGTVALSDAGVATEHPFATTFILRRSGDDRWLIVATVPLG